MPSKEFSERKGSVWERYSFEGKPWEVVRKEMDEIAMSEVTIPKNISITKGEVAGIPGKWAKMDQKQEDFLLYIHGGGFTSGSSGIAMPFVTKLMEEVGLDSFSPDYRLAPEHVFPASVEDCLSIYKELLRMGYEPEHIIVAGESAGATLSLVLLLQCKAENLPFPKAVIAMSPVTDARAEVGRSSNKVLDDLPDTAQVWNLYAPGQNLANPYISPALGNLKGMPPVFLLAGGAEPLRVDSIQYAINSVEAGNDVLLKIGKDMIHTYPLDLYMYPEAMEAFEEIVMFAKQQLKH